jgi:serine/threonine protein phosphatase 1
MNNKRIAAIGDCHGCIDELQQMLKRLEWVSLDAIYHLGDLVDRGPDSGAVVALCREKGIEGVLGNHEESILKIWDRYLDGVKPTNPDKARTISQLGVSDIDYLKSLPHWIEVPGMSTVLVHAGLWPTIGLEKQPKNVVRCQMVHPNKPGDTRWFGKGATGHKSGCTEEQNYEQGYRRWTEVYDHPFDTYYGHSVYTQPFIQKKDGVGSTIGIDTGSCFGGALTASIIGDDEPWFVTVKSRKVYFEKSYRVHQE